MLSQTEYTVQNAGNLTQRQIAAIQHLMQQGYTMRKAKRELGITKKNPIRELFKRKK